MKTINDKELKELVMKDGEKAMILLYSGIPFFDRMEFARTLEIDGVEKYEAPFDECPEFRKALYGDDLQQPCVVYLMNGKAVYEGGETESPAEVVLDIFHTIENGICGKQAARNLRPMYG